MDEKVLALLERIAAASERSAAAIEHMAMRQHFVPSAPAESTAPSDTAAALAPAEGEQTAPANTEDAVTTSASE